MYESILKLTGDYNVASAKFVLLVKRQAHFLCSLVFGSVLIKISTILVHVSGCSDE